MNYSCQEEYQEAINAEAEYEMEMEAQQAEAEQEDWKQKELAEHRKYKARCISGIWYSWD